MSVTGDSSEAGTVTRLSALIVPLKPNVEYAEKAFGCVPRTNVVRSLAISLDQNVRFARLMMLIIALNAAFLAMWDPVADRYSLPSTRNEIVGSAELFFQITYTLEMIVKLLAMGVYWEGPKAYLRSFWHWFDTVVVLTGWAAVAMDITTQGGASPLLRVIRVLRPLRGLQFVPGLQVLNNTMVRSIEQLGDLALFLALTYFFFAVVGLTIFKGKLHQRCGWQPPGGGDWRLYGPTATRFCSFSQNGGFKCPTLNVTDPDSGLARPVVCAAEFEPPNSGMTGFDNIFQALLSIFVMVTLEGWSDVMYWYSDATTKWAQLYFVALVLFGAFVVLSLITALLTVNYSAEREKVELSNSATKKKQRIAELHKATANRHKSLQKGRQDFLSDIELRLIYSFEKFWHLPGYNIVSPAMYDRYKAKHTPQEIGEFGLKVAKAMLRRRKVLHPDGEAHLFTDTAKLSREGSEEVGSESENGEIISQQGTEPAKQATGEVPEFVHASVNDAKPQARPRQFAYEEQYGIPWGEDLSRPWIVGSLYKIAMNKFFRAFIWLCIIANTVLLGFDHFLQPPQSIVVAGILNNALTGVYTVEALVKIIGLGPAVYAADKFNLFDLFVVTVSWIEIIVNAVSEGGSAAVASAFRVVRLLRVLRLAQFWGSLRTLLRTIVRTFRGVYPFTIMFAVFLYVFTVSGLLIFGGSMTLPVTEVDPVTLETVPNPSFDCTRLAGSYYIGNITHCPPRSNYDTLLWSFVTSFQVLTKENWNDVLYSAASSSGSWTPAIYFVLVVIVGSFVVLNLFLAILIDSFMDVHDQERAARRELLEKQRKLREEKKRQRKERQYRRRLMEQTVTDEEPSKIQKLQSLRRMDSTVSIASTSKTSLSGIDSDGGLKSWVRARLLTIETERSVLPLVQLPAFRHASLYIFKPTNVFRVLCAWLHQTMAFQAFLVAVIALSCVVLIIDAPNLAAETYRDSVLENINVFCVAVFVLEMTVKVVGFGFIRHEGSYLRDPWNIMDFVVVILSIADLVVADEPALGLIKSARAFRPLKLIRHIQGMRVVIDSLVLAFVPVAQIAIVAIMFYYIFAVIATLLFGGKLSACYVCEGPLCTMPLVNATTGMPGLSRNCFPYRTYGVAECKPMQQCVGGFSTAVAGASGSLQWRNPRYDGAGSEISFDNILLSLGVLYEVSTLELWPSVMAVVTDIAGTGHAPLRGASDPNSLFFVFFIFFTNFFLLQLFVASVVDSFSETDMKYSGKAFMTESQFEWVQTQHKVNKMAFSRQLAPPARRWRRVIYNLVMSPRFEYSLLAIITVNCALLASDHYYISPTYKQFLDVTDYVFGAIYIAEMLLRMIAVGGQYFRLYWFDFAIVLSIILTWSLRNTDLGEFFDVFEVFRLFRIWRVMRRHQGIANLVATLSYSIPALLNILMLVFLLFFVYAIVGMQLFGHIPSSSLAAASMNFINDYANFGDFPSAIVTLFRMSTGESWNGIMRDLASESGGAWPYCVSFIIIAQFIFLNLFVAIVLGNFNAVLTKSKKDVISAKTLADFLTAWQKQVDRFELRLRESMSATSNEYKDDEEQSRWFKPAVAAQHQAVNDERCDRLALAVIDSTYLPAAEFGDFFVCLRPPLGLPLSKSLSPSDLMRFIRIANVPVTKTGMINARATLSALVDQALGTEAGDESYDLMRSALKIRMVYDPKSTQAHTQIELERSKTHSVAEEVATRRLQLTARYLLARRRVEDMVGKGVCTADQGAEKIEQLSIQYNRDVVACLFRSDLGPLGKI